MKKQKWFVQAIPGLRKRFWQDTTMNVRREMQFKSIRHYIYGPFDTKQQAQRYFGENG